MESGWWRRFGEEQAKCPCYDLLVWGVSGAGANECSSLIIQKGTVSRETYKDVLFIHEGHFFLDLYLSMHHLPPKPRVEQ